MINQFLINEKKVKSLISSLRTVNPVNLLEALEDLGFFISPASTRFHGAFKGGLVAHSLNVYILFNNLCSKYELNVSQDDIIICSLFHDVCKCGAYFQDVGGGYVWNKYQSTGHGKLSVSMLEKIIPVSQAQKEIILYHMGIYGVISKDSCINEYSINKLLEVFSRNPISKLFYFCDEIATFEEKIEERRGLV